MGSREESVDPRDHSALESVVGPPEEVPGLGTKSPFLVVAVGGYRDSLAGSLRQVMQHEQAWGSWLL